MAPPYKRRRIAYWNPFKESEDNTETSDLDAVPSGTKHGYDHTVKQIDAAPVRTMPAVEELHIQIQHRSHPNLIERQDDAEVSLNTTSSGTLIGSSSSTNTLQVSSTLSSTQLSYVSSVSSTDASSTTLTSSISSIDSVVSSFTPAITSSAITYSSVSANKNTTNADSILASALNGTSLGAITKTGSLLTSSYTNSSYTFSLTASSSAAGSTSSGDDVVTSVYLTTATISNENGAASTITTAIGVAGYGSASGAASASSTASASIASDSSGSSDLPPPGTIAGGVVGGAAGLAVLLLVAMLVLRWYRKRSQLVDRALLPGSAGSFEDIDRGVSRDGPGMAERAGIRPWAAAAFPGKLRHLPPNYSDSSLNPAATPERGFQRISGRKLPSAWSPGMEGLRPPLPIAAPYRNSSTSSFYPDGNVDAANPFEHSPDNITPEGAPSLSKQSSDERMTVYAGPQRRPTIHNPNRRLIPGDDGSQAKHMSSIARTSGTATTLLSPENSHDS